MKNLAIALALVAAILSCVCDSKPETVEVPHTVSYGESMWGIMSSRISNEYDIREYIYLTTQRNNIANAEITPGQKIVLVLPKE